LNSTGGGGDCEAAPDTVVLYSATSDPGEAGVDAQLTATSP
jgi:hypothetical protein